MNQGVIYELIDPRTNQVRYIGQTIQSPTKRLNKHFTDCVRFDTHVNCWIKSLRELGLRPIINVIEECDREKLDELEIYHIQKYKNDGHDLTNSALGGHKNRIFSEETKQKISNSLKGKKQSDLTKERRRASVTEAWKSEELKSKQKDHALRLHAEGKIGQKGIPSKNKGLPFTGDKRKVSDSLKIYFSEESKRDERAIKAGGKPFKVYKKGILNKETNQYELGEYVTADVNISKVCRLLNLQNAHVGAVLKKRLKQTKGYIFVYEDELNQKE